MTEAFGRTRGISGSTLKWIAIITMFIDHVGAILIEKYLFSMGSSSWSAYFPGLGMEQLFQVDLVLRYIGRIGFPLFAFLLVEGFLHTHDVKRYALRLGIFALLSEIPFDLAFRGRVFEPGYQNVFFTLLLGLLAIWCLQEFRDRAIIGMLGVIAAGAAALVLNTDYDVFGVLFIVAMYVFRREPWLRAVAGSLILLMGYGMIEITAVLAFLFIALYNGTRGKQSRYFFYVFYPAHILLLWAVGRYLLPVVLS